jgi:hypothetical protein
MSTRTAKLAVCLLVPVFVVLTSPDAGATGRGHATLPGTWMVKVEFEFNYPPPGLPSPFTLAFLQQFHADGRTTLLLPFGEGHPNENDRRVGCMGEWRPRRGAGRTYDVTTRCLFNQDGEGPYQQSRGIIRMTGKDTFEGSFEMVTHAADGSILFSLGWGENTATRVKVHPLTEAELP